MIPEIGHFALILALCLAFLQCVMPLLGLYYHRPKWIPLARPLALGQSFFVTLAVTCLLYALVQDDFSVASVALHSNASLPLRYKISAMWGGHEGSLLLWIFLLCLWTLALSFSTRRQSVSFFATVIAILGIISVGFLLLLLTTSNPFERFLPFYPIDGRDLNPLLQDPGLIFHPPLLYMGYVGFSIPFAFAVSILLSNISQLPWAKWMRTWVLLAFGFLTLGILLGSWWAYYELGWGGWWFWDPVENASFLPWLIGLALIHSLMLSDKRQAFQAWTLLLSILVFGFSLMGTFLVRSGILTSVHAFATDPKRGIFILLFLSIIVGSALILYTIRVSKFIKTPTIEFLSRETFILISTICLFVACFSILLGTLFPLIYDTLTGQKISVGFPYFNAIFIPLMLPVLLLVPIGPLSSWGHNGFWDLFKKLKWVGIFSIILATFILFFPVVFSTGVAFGLCISFWIILGTLKSAILKIKKRGGIRGLSFGAWGMLLAHVGMGITVLGITLVSHYQIERTVRLSPGQSIDIADYHIIFKGLDRVEGPNYISHKGHFQIFKQVEKQTQSIQTSEASKVADLFPEKRIFVVQGASMSETAIDVEIFRDIYIALGERLTSIEWSARIYYKPFVRWIWAGAFLMAMGGLFAAWGRRK